MKKETAQELSDFFKRFEKGDIVVVESISRLGRNTFGHFKLNSGIGSKSKFNLFL
ncbi:hypothetical protein JG559_07570 [Enterococcus faecalis]|uniref:Resolvase/invertase-type recombinase catalytic domain-containing protein n=1 Tax=Enterococcus faecalis TaxID=1351 RepID=A0A974NYS5_ENTFL|nr:hypothetical protein JG559_07570 [Enterococcus faecalis]